MAIDLNGPRFYTQQLTKRGTPRAAKARLKKDILLDIEDIVDAELKSFMNLTKPTLEVIYGALYIQKR